MLFRKKDRLKKEYDQKLIDQLSRLKNSWDNQRYLAENSVDPAEEIICQAKLAEAKYFFLFKEAKARNITIKKW